MSLVTAGTQASIVVWMAFDLTKSTRQVAATQLAFQCMSVVSSPLAGWLNDRFRKTSLLAITSACNAAAALLFAVVIHLGAVRPSFLLAYYSVVGLLFGLEIVGRFSYIGDVSPKPAVHRNIAYVGALSNLARVVGPLVGAGGVMLLGNTGCIGLHAVASMLNCALLMTRVPAPDARPRSDGPTGDSTRSLAEFSRRYRVHFLLGCLSFVAILSYGVVLNLPALTTRLITGGAYPHYVALSFSFAVGSVLGTLSISNIERVHDVIKKISVHTALAGACLLGLARLSSVYVVSGLLFVAGFCMTSLFPQVNAFLNRQASPEFRGKLMGTYSIVTGSAAAAAVLVQWLLSRTLDQSSVFLLLGVSGVVAGVALSFVRPRPDARRACEHDPHEASRR
jgi:MFS family permease